MKNSLKLKLFILRKRRAGIGLLSETVEMGWRLRFCKVPCMHACLLACLLVCLLAACLLVLQYILIHACAICYRMVVCLPSWCV